MTAIAIIGWKALIGDSREFQDVRGIGVKPVGAEFRLRDMSVNDQGSELVTQGQNTTPRPGRTGSIPHGA